MRASRNLSSYAAEDTIEQTWHASQSRLQSPHIMEGFVSEPELRPGQLDIANSDLWINEPVLGSYWPFMPFSSQLETLPPGLDSPNLE